MTVFRTITAALIWIAAFGGSASAETWPQRYVRIIVPFSAGGAADVVTRIVAAHIAENLGKNVVVENRTGSNGNIGTEAVARSLHVSGGLARNACHQSAYVCEAAVQCLGRFCCREPRGNFSADLGGQPENSRRKPFRLHRACEGEAQGS